MGEFDLVVSVISIAALLSTFSLALTDDGKNSVARQN